MALAFSVLGKWHMCNHSKRHICTMHQRIACYSSYFTAPLSLSCSEAEIWSAVLRVTLPIADVVRFLFPNWLLAFLPLLLTVHKTIFNKVQRVQMTNVTLVWKKDGNSSGNNNARYVYWRRSSEELLNVTRFSRLLNIEIGSLSLFFFSFWL